MEAKRSILVTGCSDGSLGSRLAVALHNAGWRVFASARNPAKLSDVKAAGIECLQMDVVSDESILDAVKQVTHLTNGSLDGLVNNAGMTFSAPAIEMDIDKAHQVFDVNLFSVVRVSRAFLPLLLKSQKGPIIANNTTGMSFLGCSTPFHGPYSASKAATTHLTESLRLELAPFGIRVINIVTGGVKSTFFDGIEGGRPKIKEGSIYTPAKDEIESAMVGGDDPNKTKSDPVIWARQVAEELSQRKPPHMIFRGSQSSTARLATLLPIGTLDSIHKKNGAIDVLEKRLAEQDRKGKSN